MPYKNKSDQNEYIKKWVQARRNAWMLAHGPCKCGSWEDLELDHIDPSTKARGRDGHPIKGTRNIWTWSYERRTTELAKCQVLCRLCHKQKTRNEYAARVFHGSDTMYRKHGCRCALCRRAHAAKLAQWRYNKRLAGPIK